jgi:hypothetical protein
MNVRFLVSNLEEAEEDLRQLVEQLKAGQEPSFGDFHSVMAHVYHHLNSAWNARNVTDAEWRECTEENYNKWQKFPHDLPLHGDDNFFDLPEYNQGI